MAVPARIKQIEEMSVEAHKRMSANLRRPPELVDESVAPARSAAAARVRNLYKSPVLRQVGGGAGRGGEGGGLPAMLGER